MQSKIPTTNQELFGCLFEAKMFLLEKLGSADIALVLGSGLSELMEEGFENVKSVEFTDIPAFPRSTVEGHKGSLFKGEYKGKSVLVWAGRIHRYEGYTTYEMNLISLISASIGCQWLVNTNAAGGGLPGMKPGALMLITDHFNSIGYSPLKTLINDPRFLPKRVFDSSNSYAQEIFSFVKEVAHQIVEEGKTAPETEAFKYLDSSTLFEGVYWLGSGPSFETNSETRQFCKLGAGAFGMSTVPELLTGNMLGMKNFNITLVTNLACHLSPHPLSHQEVHECANICKPKLKYFLLKLVESMVIDPEKKKHYLELFTEKSKNMTIEEFNIMPTKDLPIPQTKNIDSLEIDIEFDLTYLFLNPVKTTEIQKYFDDFKTIQIKNLKNFPIFSASAKKGEIVYGKLKGGNNCLSLTNCEIDGFFPIEANYLSKLFHKLKIQFATIIVSISESGEETGEFGELVPIEDYFGFSNKDVVHFKFTKIDYQMQSFLSQKIQILIGKPPKCLAGFEAPTIPSKFEKSIAKKMGFDYYTINGLDVVQNLQFEGISTAVVGTKSTFQNEITPEQNFNLFALLFEKMNNNLFVHDLHALSELHHEKALFLKNALKADFEQGLELFMQQSDSVALDMPNSNSKEKIDEVASSITQYFGEIPKKAIVLLDLLFPLFQEHIEIKKTVTFTCSTYNTTQRLPRVFLAVMKSNNTPVVVVDNILIPEFSLPEVFPTIPEKILIRAGVEKFVMITEVTGVNSDLKAGDFCIVKDHIQFFANNPLFGLNIKEYGTRFPPIGDIYTKQGDFDLLKKNLVESLHVAETKAAWLNYSKPLCFTAEKNIAKALEVDVICKRGIANALITHHMNYSNKDLGIDVKTEVILMGIVQRQPIDKSLDYYQLRKKAKFFFNQFVKLLK